MRIELRKSLVRSWEVRDAASLATHANSRDVWINLRDAFPHPYSRGDAEQFIDRSRIEEPETNFAIEVGSEAVGAIGFRLGEDVERTSAEVGYWLGKQFWGRGIVSEALVAVRDYAIERHSLTRVFALPFAWNVASFRVLEKAGFEFEGKHRRSALKDGQVIDQHVFAYVVPEG